MKNYVKNFMLGALTSLVPIMILSFYHGRMIKNDLDYSRMVRYLPFVMGIINMIVFAVWVEPFTVENFFIVGAGLGLIYSCYGRYVAEIPQKISKLDNENCYHLYEIVLWAVVYGVGVDYLYKNFT